VAVLAFLTDLRQSEIEKMQADVASGILHPMEAKKRLARTIVAGFHSEEAARKADEDWAMRSSSETSKPRWRKRSRWI
jgi:tyrosyl-tRNA synthetase